MTAGVIRIRGARTHNLRAVDLDLPRDRLIVITGPSGSGKSSLAFDTIFAEGQRRYVESLSVSARQFLAQLPKPDADLIDGLSPSVAIEQGGVARNPRSTVGTVTEVYDFLRLLYARVGTVYSARSGKPMVRHTIEQMLDTVLGLPAGTRFSVLAPVAVRRAGGHRELLEDLRGRGFVRVAIDDEVHDLSDEITIEPRKRHTIEVYVDRLKLKEGLRARLADSLEVASGLSGGLVRILSLAGDDLTFSERYVDLEHGITYPEITPATFSFNSPQGACETCSGLGFRRVFDPEKMVPDASRSLQDGAILPWSKRAARSQRDQLITTAKHLGVDPYAPWSSLSVEARVVLLQGSGTEVIPDLGRPFEGAIPILERRLRDAEARAAHDDDEDAGYLDLESVVSEVTCGACGGERLRPEARTVRVGEHGIHALTNMSLDDLTAWLRARDFADDGAVAEVVVEPALRRLDFLREVGLGYLTLDRSARSLSGGEMQRIRLATQVGAALVGVTYVLDEPSIGLHPRDTDRLLGVLRRLRDLGNTVIVVEHDPATIRAADLVVDMGPGAGVDGGRVVAQGTVAEIEANPDSLTGAYLSGRRRMPAPSRRRKGSGRSLAVKRATGNNLRGLTMRAPLGAFTCVTGVSGSGKSSLVIDTLLRAAARDLHRAGREPLPYGSVVGLEHLDKVIYVDQSPIGRSPRSNPATYTGVFTELRSVYAKLPESRVRGYQPARFSFNVKGGRCESCRGDGVRRIEMHFLPDVFAKCTACDGRRYNRESLAIELRGKNIADVLEMSVASARDFFATHPNIRNTLEVLQEVGLGYLTLGQSATTLSGGEAQRIKLARELARRSTGQTLFVLDEPTTGLHFRDVEMLLRIFDRLVDEGNTLLVIEHDPAVIGHADHVIDLGPGGGVDGGEIVVAGTPEQVAACAESHTGRHLRAWLG